MLERHHGDVRMIQQCLHDALGPDHANRLAEGGTLGPDPDFGPYAGLGNEACLGLYRVTDGGHHHDVSRDSSRHLGGL